MSLNLDVLSTLPSVGLYKDTHVEKHAKAAFTEGHLPSHLFFGDVVT